MTDPQSNNDADATLARISAIADSMQKATAEALKEMRDSATEQRRLFLDAVINARQELQRNFSEWNNDHARDQSTVMDDAKVGGANFSIRYRNGTAETPPVDIHRLEWIAKASPYDPSTITEGNPIGDEWANDLWQPVLHGDFVEYGT